MATEMIETKAADTHREEALTLRQKATALRITDETSYRQAREILAAKKDIDRQARDLLSGPISDAHRLHKKLVAALKTITDPLEEIERTVKAEIGRFEEAQRRAQREAEERQRREQEEATRRAQEAAKAEEKRLADERAADAERLAEAGDVEAACELLDAPAPIVLPAPVFVAPLAPPVVKVEGVSTRFRWVGRVVRPEAVPRELCSPDQKLIDARVAALGSAAVGAIPGVVVTEEPIVSNRT